MADQGQSSGPTYRPNPSNDEQEKLEDEAYAGGSRVFSGGSVSGGGVIPRAYGRSQEGGNPGVVSWYSDRAWDDSRPGVASEPKASGWGQWVCRYKSVDDLDPPGPLDWRSFGGMGPLEAYFRGGTNLPYTPGWHFGTQLSPPSKDVFFLAYPWQDRSWGTPWVHQDRYAQSGKFVPKTWRVEGVSPRYAKYDPVISRETNLTALDGGPLLDLQCAIDNLPKTVTIRWSIIDGKDTYTYYKTPFAQTTPHPIANAADAGTGPWFKGHNENIPGIDEWKSDIIFAFAKWKEMLETRYTGLTINFVQLPDETWGGAAGPLNGGIPFSVADHPEAADIRFSMAPQFDYDAASTRRRPLCLGYPSLGKFVSIGSNITISPDYRWRPDDRSDPFSLSIAYCVFHEIGHYLGMAHNKDWTSLMQVSQQSLCLENKPNAGGNSDKAFYTSWSEDLNPRVGGTAEARDMNCLDEINGISHKCAGNCERLGVRVPCPRMEVTITAADVSLPKTWCGITWQPSSVEDLGWNERYSGESATVCPNRYDLAKRTTLLPDPPPYDRRINRWQYWHVTGLELDRYIYVQPDPSEWWLRQRAATNHLQVDGRQDEVFYWYHFGQPFTYILHSQLGEILGVPIPTLNSYRLTNPFFGLVTDGSGVTFTWKKQLPDQWL